MKADTIRFVALIAIIVGSIAAMVHLNSRKALPRSFSENQMRQMIREEVRAALDGGTR